MTNQQELSQLIYESRLDNAVAEVLADKDQRDAAIEEQKRVWVEQEIQRIILTMIEKGGVA